MDCPPTNACVGLMHYLQGCKGPGPDLQGASTAALTGGRRKALPGMRQVLLLLGRSSHVPWAFELPSLKHAYVHGGVDLTVESRPGCAFILQSFNLETSWFTEVQA